MMGSNSGEQEANLANRRKRKSVVRWRPRGNGIEALSEQFLHPFHGGLLSVLDLDPVGSAMNGAANKKTARRRSLYAGGVAPLSLSLIRCMSMVMQAFSASASVLKGEPPTFMALLF